MKWRNPFRPKTVKMRPRRIRAMCDAVFIFFGFVLRDCESVDLGLPAKPTNRLVRRMQLSGDFLASPISRRPGQVVAA